MNNVIVLPTTTKVERTEPAAVPDYITPASIEEMNDEQLDALVAAIQARRMRPYEIYKRTKEEKHALEQSKTKEKITKKCEMIIKTINAADKALEKLEHQIAELRGLRLQAELELI